MKLSLPALFAGLVLSAAASAAPIGAGSTISLSGDDNFTATSVTFTSLANIGALTGDFAASGLVTCATCVNMTSFTSVTPTPFVLYTATQGPLSTSLSVGTTNFDFTPDPTLANLTVRGTGTLALSGFDPTPGEYILTTQGPTGIEVTFSVTSLASPVAEPASLGILGAALMMLGFLRRKVSA